MPHYKGEVRVRWDMDSPVDLTEVQQRKLLARQMSADTSLVTIYARNADSKLEPLYMRIEIVKEREKRAGRKPKTERGPAL